MRNEKFKEAIFSIVNDNDPYKVSKQLQLKNWCYVFLPLFDRTGKNSLSFFLDVLSDGECWEDGVRLNRRIAAKKIIEPKSRNGEINSFDDFERYQYACWCCLEDEVIALFEHFKQEDEIEDNDKASLRELMKQLSGSWYTDPMMEYWSYIANGCVSELRLKGRHHYEYGLSCALGAQIKFVEAVEFFWDKIESLPENELSTQQKDKIFMRAAVRATGTYCKAFPEIFEFCFSRISSDKYSDLLKRDFDVNEHYNSLWILYGMLHFDQFQELFDCLRPNNILENWYHIWLRNIVEIKDYPDCYARAGFKLFMHMWMKEGFDKHRAFVFDREVTDGPFVFITEFLASFIRRDDVELLWAALDKADSDEIKRFMSSKRANYIRSVLEERGYKDLLSKFLSYGKLAVEG